MSEDWLLDTHGQMTRSVRRHFRERKILRMLAVMDSWHGGFRGDKELMAKKMADNPKLCSAICCSHRRRTEGPIISELRRIQAAAASLEIR
jgi:hypothetical protein